MQPHDLSVMGMFQQADWVVKAVMLILVLASVITWTIWAVKTRELRRARLANRSTLSILNRASSLQALLNDESHKQSPLLSAAQEELKQSGTLPAAGIKERLEGRFQRIQSDLSRRAKAGTGILATVGSTGPFVGLFGTVWGIMNSFIGIAEAQTTNLAVVAPGIAEALLATALGLVAAIPAVVLYNQFARVIGDYRAQLSDLSGEVLRLTSLHLDQKGQA